MQYFQNKHGYFLRTALAVNTEQLDTVTCLSDQQDAEARFRERNELDENHDVFIPLIEKDEEQLMAQGDDTIFRPIETSLETFISTRRV